MEENLYFAYGSNLDLEQMAQRCPDAEIVGPVRLENYELRFRGSGFATVAPKKGSTVHGLVWKLTPNCEQSLDRYAAKLLPADPCHFRPALPGAWIVRHRAGRACQVGQLH